MAESKQHWLDRNRPPRVQITYDVEIGNAIEKKDIPFVVGVMSDLSGDSDISPAKVKDRKFIEIDRDNFNEVMAKVGPTAKNVIVDDKISKNEDGTPKGGKLALTLAFSQMDDFRPEALVQQIDPLRKLLEARVRLNDLLAKLQGNDELNAKLLEIVASDDKLTAIKNETSS
jgi:type VI secretion system protein ImpB